MKEQTNQKKKGVLLPALICMLVLTLLCGLVYPLVVTGISQVAFHSQANGSIITVTLKDGDVYKRQVPHRHSPAVGGCRGKRVSCVLNRC